jgi:ABC-type Co2+ transport system permease subunit
MILPSLLIMAIFYFLIRYPFCRWYHWLIGIVSAILITGILTYNVLVENLAVFVLDTESYPDINSFITTFIVFNLVLAFIAGFIWTLIFKRAPLPQRNVPFGGKK